MAIRVTNPITKHGRYYAAGEIIEQPTQSEHSYRRLYGWELVDDSKTEPQPQKKLGKPQLVELARERGFDVVGLTKAEIVELLEED